MMESRLPFLHMGLSLPGGKTEANLFMLKDSGCERSIISTKLLKKLDLNWLERMEEPDVETVKTASGHMTTVIGMITVNVRFQSIHPEHTQDMTVWIKFLIVADEMTKKAYLGADFLQNDDYKPEENNLYITVAPAKKYHVAGPDLIHVEVFYKENIDHTKMIIKECISLEAWESKWCSVIVDDNLVDEKNFYEIDTDVAMTSIDVNVEGMGVHLPKEQKVLVANKSDLPVRLEAGEVVASAKKIEDDIIASFRIKVHDITEEALAPERPKDAKMGAKSVEINEMLPESNEVLIGKVKPTTVLKKKKNGVLLELLDLELITSGRKTVSDVVLVNNIETRPNAKDQSGVPDAETSYVEEKPEDLAEQCIGPHFDLEDTKEDNTRLRDRFNTGKLSDHEKEPLLKIIEEFPEVFGKSKLDIGAVPNHFVRIDTDGSVFSDKFRPFKKGTKDIIMKIINTYMDVGIFEIAPQSPYAMNLFLVRKPIPPEVLEKDPDAINNPEYFRALLDGRSLNRITVGHSLSLGQYEDLFLKIGNAKYIIMIDIISAFFNVQIRPEDRVLTSFYTPIPGVKAQFTRLVQGLKNSQLEFCSLMGKLLKPIEASSALYVDDVCLFHDTFEGICDVFRKALQIFSANNIKLLPQKTSLLPDSIKFLGIHWSKNGTLSVPKAKIQAFSNWPTPIDTRKKVQSFCSAVQFFRKFIHNLSGLMKPLTEMLKKEKKVVWNEKAQKAFRDIVAALEENVQLHIPTKGCTFRMHTDASKFACAARLCFMDDDNVERLVACSSRTFSESAAKCSTFHQELLGLVFAIRSYEGWITFSPCVIFLDCISLTYLALTKNSTPSIMRISIYLSQFGNFTYVHVRSKHNMADSLTRNAHQVDEVRGRVKIKPLTRVEAETILRSVVIPDGKLFDDAKVRQLLAAHPLPSIFQKTVKCRCKVILPPTRADILGAESMEFFEHNEYELDEGLSDETILSNIDLEFENCGVAICSKEEDGKEDLRGALVAALTSESPLTGESMAKLQRNDPFCVDQLKRIDEGKKSQFKIGQDGVLYSKQNGDKIENFSRPRPVLPEVVFNALMFKIHSSIEFGAHGGPKITEKTLRERYFVPMLTKRVQEYCDNCIWCQQGKNNRIAKSITHGNIRASSSMEAVAMDLALSFPTSKNSETNILLMVDLFSGFCIAIPLTSKGSDEILTAYQRSWEQPFGHPRAIRCDGERGIVCGEFEKHCKQNNIAIYDTSSGASWVNGAAEKKIALLKCQLSAVAIQCKTNKDWEKMIAKILNINNNTVRSGRFTAAEIMYGRRTRSPFDVMPENFEYATLEEYVEMSTALKKEIDTLQKEHLRKKFEKRIEDYNRGKVEHSYKVDDLVWLKNVKIPQGTGNAVKPKFQGPFRVLEIVDKVTAWIMHIHVGKVIRRHFNLLKPVVFDEKSEIMVSANWDINLADGEGPEVRRSTRNKTENNGNVESK